MSKDDQNNDSTITDSPPQTEELTVSEKPPVDFARLFAQDTDYGNTSINLIDRIWTLLKEVIILMVIFFVIWGVYQFLNREEEKQCKSK
jgi:hypothetical protein